MFLAGSRIATESGDHELALRFYEKVVDIEIPIPGGHSDAISHAAYHYQHAWA